MHGFPNKREKIRPDAKAHALNARVPGTGSCSSSIVAVELYKVLKVFNFHCISFTSCQQF